MAVRPEDFGAVEAVEQKPTATPRPEDFGAKEESGVLGSVLELFTGSDRETEETKSLPEGVQIPFELSKRQAGAALGLLTTFDPVKQMSVLRDAYPDLTFSEDKKGNIIVDAGAYGGGKGLLNAPGVSLADLTRLGFQVAAFTPAGRLSAGAGALGGAAKVAAGSAATQAGMDVVGQALGATGEGESPGVQVADISVSDVAMAAAGGGVGEAVGRGLMRFMPALRRTEAMPIDGSVKKGAKSALDDIAAHEQQFGPTSREFQLRIFRDQGISDDIANMILDEVPPVKAAQAASAESEGLSREFRIPYTAGQRSGSPAQLQAEEAMRAGGSTPEAQQMAVSFKGTQDAAIEEAVKRYASQMSAGPMVSGTQEAAEVVTEGVQTAAARMDDAVKSAYEAVPKGTFMRPEGALSVAKGIRRSVRGLEFDTSLPQTSKALSDMGKMEKALKVLENNGARVPFRTVEQYRKKLNGYIRSAESPEDQRQVLLMKRALDDYVGQSVADGLLFGADDAAGVLRSVEDARAMRRMYAEMFEPQPSKTKAGVRDTDPAGQIINKMAELDPDAGDVAAALFGSGNLLGRKNSAELVRRLKSALGPDSQEFQAVKQAAFLRLFGVDKGQLTSQAAEGPVRISGTQALKSIQEAMEGRSKDMARELFDKDEIAGMVKLARAIKRAQPTPFNPSGTAGQANAQWRESLNKITQLLGFAGGPIQGALMTVGQKGVAEVSEANANALARQVFSGRPLQVVGQKLPGGAVGAPSIQQAQQSAQPQ